MTPQPENAGPASRVGFEVASRLLGEDPAEPLYPAIPGYRFARALGKGPRGAVYRVFKETAHHPLALKLLAAPMDGPGARQPARHTAETLAGYQLNFVVPLLDHGFHEHYAYLVSEFIDGAPADEFCRRSGAPLPLRARAELLARISDAVQLLHDHNIAHGALKPSNILVTLDGSPHLTDWADATVLGAHPLPPADVHALAALALALLTDLHFQDPAPTPPPQSLSTLPSPLRAVLRKALAPSPSGRYPSAADFSADLRRWLNGEKVQAIGPGLLTRFMRRLRRAP